MTNRYKYGLNSLDASEESHIIDRNRKNGIPGKIARKLLKIACNFMFYFVIAAAVAIVVFMVQNKMAKDTKAFLGVSLYIVQSGSMEPAMKTGSLAIVRSTEADILAAGDVITFKDADSGKLITHRITGVNILGDSYEFITKGDANENVDQTAVAPADIIGKVMFSIPLIGYLLNIAQTKTGLLFMVMVPGALIIFLELRKIFQYADMSEKKKSEKESVLVKGYKEKEL